MASAWEGAARGLESGFRLAMDVNERQRQASRQEGLDARAEAQQGLQNQRQAANDGRLQEEQDYNRRRQVSADERAMLDRRKKELTTRAAVYNPATTDAATMEAFSNDEEALSEAETAWMARNGGASTGASTKVKAQAMADEAAAVEAGTAPPPVMLKHAARAARVPLQHLVRKDGQPSVIDQIVQAQMGDDPQAKVKGWNVLLHQDLQVGVGQDSPHGGKIVRKDIDSLTPDPTDPQGRVIPTLKVWVSKPRGADAGVAEETKMREAFKKANPDAPADATGFYLAPMTEGRSADRKGDDKVKSVSITEGMARLDNMMQLVETVNAPEGQQAFAQLMAEQQAQGTADPAARLKASRARLGVNEAPKATVDEFTLKQGDVRVRRRIDAQGNVVPGSEVREQGNAKTYRDTPTDQAARLMEDFPERFPTIDDAAKFMQRNGLSRQPTKYSGGGLSAGGGRGGGGSGADGGDGLSTAQKRKRDADRAEAKDAADRAEKSATAAETALRDYNNERGSMGARKSTPEVEQERVDLTTAAKKARARAASLSDALDKPAAAPAPAPAAAGKGKLTKDAAAAKFGF